MPSTITSVRLFTSYHDLYQAYYFQSKGLCIDREREALTAVWGTHKHLCSYFKLIVAAFNSLSKRSRSCFETKWERTFGETVTDNYNDCKRLNKQHRLAGVASPAMMSAAVVPSDTSDDFNPFLLCDLDSLRTEVSKTLANIEMHPNYNTLPTEVAQQVLSVKGLVLGYGDLHELAISEPCDHASGVAAVAIPVAHPVTTPVSVVSNGCSTESTSVFDALETASTASTLPYQRSPSPSPSPSPVTSGCAPASTSALRTDVAVKAEPENEFEQFPDDFTDHTREIATVIDAVVDDVTHHLNFNYRLDLNVPNCSTLQMALIPSPDQAKTDDLEMAYVPPHNNALPETAPTFGAPTGRSDMFGQPLLTTCLWSAPTTSTAPLTLPPLAAMARSTQELVDEADDDDLDLTDITPQGQSPHEAAPLSTQPPIDVAELQRMNRNHIASIGRSTQWSVYAQHQRYAGSPIVLPTVAAELDPIYLTTNVLSTLVRAYPRVTHTLTQHLNGLERLGLNDEVEVGPYEVTDPYDTSDCINPTSPPPPFRPQPTPAPEPSIEPAIHVVHIPQPIQAPQAPQAPRAFTPDFPDDDDAPAPPYTIPAPIPAQVTPSEMTASDLSQVLRARKTRKATSKATSKATIKAKVPKKMKAAAEPKLERLHWPEDPDDRKGLYIAMLWDHTPFETDIIWTIYAYCIPEELNAKYWKGKYEYWKVAIRSVELDASFRISRTAFPLPPQDKQMEQVTYACDRAEYRMRQEWLALRRAIIDTHSVRRENELEDFIQRMQDTTNDLRAMYQAATERKNRKKRKVPATMKASAEPVQEKPQDDPEDGLGEPLRVETLVLGNQEQYIEENGLSSQDFADTTEPDFGVTGCAVIAVPPLVPVLAPTVVWACPEARAVVRMSREPAKPLPSFSFDSEENEVDLTFAGGMQNQTDDLMTSYGHIIRQVSEEMHRPLTNTEITAAANMASKGFLVLQIVNEIKRLEAFARVMAGRPKRPQNVQSVRIHIDTDIDVQRRVIPEPVRTGWIPPELAQMYAPLSSSVEGVHMPSSMYSAPKTTGGEDYLQRQLNREYKARMSRRQVPLRTFHDYKKYASERPAPTRSDQYIPLSPTILPEVNEADDFGLLAPEPSISPPRGRVRLPQPGSRVIPPPPSRPLPLLPPPVSEDIFRFESGVGSQDFGKLERDEKAVEDYFGDDYQEGGWVIQTGKVLKPVTLEEDPITGRLRVPAKKVIGRPRIYGPELPAHLKRSRGRPKGSKNKPKVAARVRKFVLNERGEPVLTEAEIAGDGVDEEEFDPFADLPPASLAVPVGLTKREYKRRARLLEKQLQRIKKDRAPGKMALLLQRAQGLPGFPGLSNHVTNVYRRSTDVGGGKHLTYLGFKFNAMKRMDRLAESEEKGRENPEMALASAAVLGPLQMFQRQTLNLENYLRQVMERPVVMWRTVIIYNTELGQHVTSTTWSGEYSRMYNQAQLKIANIIAQYGEENVEVTHFDVRVRYQKQMLIGGLTDKQYQSKFGELERNWVIVNPRSRTNCLWTAIAICSGYAANDQLIYSNKNQNQSGLNLKRRVGTRNPKGGTDEDLQKCANHKSLTIIVHDLAGLEIGRFAPTDHSVGDIHVLLHMGHYHAMLRADDPFVQQHKSQIGEVKKRELKVIKKCTKDFDLRRIVAYDLESYRSPLDAEDPDKEVDQIAYAVGWAFETRDIGEMKEAEDMGYQIIDAEVRYGSEMRRMYMAYKRELGDGCLDKAIDEWLHNPMFDGSVVYAHNGGKFDLRLIMGQSNLLYADMYVIVPDKLVDLNGRLINMDVENTFQRYKRMVTVKGKEIEREFNHFISIRDSIPLFGPGSGLAKLTEELDVPHKKLKELINVHELQNVDTWNENWNKYDMDKYLLYDVCGLLEVLTKFNCEVTEGTEIPITAINTGASLSKKYFLKHHYKNTTDVDVGGVVKQILDPSKSIYSLDPDMDLFIRNGYGGGRCEAFYCGVVDEPSCYYDFTSLYPDVGRLEMPVGQPKWVCDIERFEQDRIASEERVQRAWNSRVVAGNRFGTTCYWKVRVRSPLAAAGNMMDPLHRKPLFGMKEEGMYVFRWFADWLEMVLYEEEIVFAIEHGLDYEFVPINGIVFEKSVVLKDCMEDLFIKKAEAKAQGKPGLAQSWKIIINSLYGVWGLKVLAREGIEIARPEQSNWTIDMVTEKLMDLERIGKYIVTRRLKDLEVKDCNVALAAAVTSEARMKLYRLMMDIQDKGGKILYGDTDSLITDLCIETNAELCEKWIGPSQGKDLGSLKNEIEECYEKWNKKHPEAPLTYKHHFDRAVIVAPKMYIVTAEDGRLIKKAHKGYKENTATGDIVTYDRMFKLVNKDIREARRYIEQDTYQWLGGNADILKNQVGVRIVRRHKRIQGLCRDGHPINKGILKADGAVVPFITRMAKRKARRLVKVRSM